MIQEISKEDIKVYKLGKDMAEDYIHYFDNRAFLDGDREKGCYCVWHHWTDKHEYERSLMPENERSYCKRNYAKELIQNGKLNGFAAVYENQIIGFLNADIKDHYFRLSKEHNPNSWVGTDANDKILSVVCFIVAPDMRRKGIAKALLSYACQYAGGNGYDYVEGYPPQGEFTIHDCGGSVSMYINHGFKIINVPDGIIARKKLKSDEQ